MATTPLTLPRTTMPTGSPPPVTVEVTASVDVEETVDLVTLFAGMDERAQRHYLGLDLSEYGMSAEWERPLAYLWPDAEDLVPMSLITGANKPPFGDIQDSNVRVIKRNGERTSRDEREWTEDDYRDLSAQVHWLPLPTDKRAATEDRRDPIDGPVSLTVEVTATVGADQSVDVHALFNAMDTRTQARYFDLDIAELGMGGEFERPLAYLLPDDDDLIPYTMIPRSPSHPRGHVDDLDVRVVKRHDTLVFGEERRWTREDYLTLADNVPWLGRHVYEQQMSAADRARMPGPGDVPLFD